jgi:hypothetical protein
VGVLTSEAGGEKARRRRERFESGSERAFSGEVSRGSCAVLCCAVPLCVVSAGLGWC